MPSENPCSAGVSLVERVTGIEPAWPAWKAGALPLSYTRGGPPGRPGAHLPITGALPGVGGQPLGVP